MMKTEETTEPDTAGQTQPVVQRLQAEKTRENFAKWIYEAELKLRLYVLFDDESHKNREITNWLLEKLVKWHEGEMERAYETGWANAAGEAQAVCEKRAESLGSVALQCEARKCGYSVWHNLMELPEVELVPVIE